MNKLVAEQFDLLGRKAVDKISGVKGVITSINFDLYGCIQAVLSPKGETGGKWYDVSRLKVGKGEKVMECPQFENIEKGGYDKPLP